MKKVMLLILDGFGYSETKEHNAILQAKADYIHSLFKNYPFSLIRTDGEHVGLPSGVMGNSEVGHISIGSGRIVYQDLTKITKFCTEEGFTKKPELHKLAGKHTIHIMGLLSDGGVHSHQSHLYALIDFYHKEYPEQKVALHIITDGRDTAPNSGIDYVQDLEKFISTKPNIEIVSLSGRYYAMDRDQRWERTELAYRNLFNPSVEFASASEAVKASYANEIGDEFIKPCKISALVPNEKDAFVFTNFRSDRARQISLALAGNKFQNFTRDVIIKEDRFVCFTAYSEDFNFPVLFPKESPKNTIGEILQDKGLKQLRIAETEKYAHVTYFFNGGEEKVFEGEDRILVPSPKEVATYDLKPEMSAPELTEKLIAAVNLKKYDLIVCNYANGDMVGHTGDEAAAIKAVEALNTCLEQLIPLALKQGYTVLLTADHGNCEEMRNMESGEAFTQHSMNPVPFIIIGAGDVKAVNGSLQDIAPSILKLMSIEKPKEMMGRPLF